MGGVVITGIRGLVFLVVCFLLSFDFREWGSSSRYDVGLFRAAGVAVFLAVFGRTLWERFAAWRQAPAAPFPHLSTEGLPAATAKALPVYLAVTAVVLAPMLPHFFTHVYADGGDGMQMVWNVWWFKTSLATGTSPFYTEYLHAPAGTTLWGASYHPLKSLLAAPLVPLIGLLPAYNALFVATLVGCSLSAFALGFVVSRSFVGSLAAGAAFGFWNNRFAHLNGHLHTVSTELVPLFLLCLLLWLSKPTFARSIWLSVLLLGSLLLDHYGFLFNAFLFVFVMCWAIYRQRGNGFLFRKPYFMPLAAFTVLTLATSGALAAYVLGLSRSDPWGGAHGPRENSADLFAFFVPGAYSWMAPLTRGYWSHVLSGEIEGSIYAGVTVLVLAVLGYRRGAAAAASARSSEATGSVGSRRPPVGDGTLLDRASAAPAPSAASNWVGLFAGLALFFWILSLGPYLQVGGRETPYSLPYLFFQQTLPFLRMSGVPVRFVQVALLACSVSAAIYLSTLRRKAVVAVVIGLLAIDLVPKLPAMTAPEVPKYVLFLKELSGKPAVVDAASSMTMHLYYQTVHEKPLAFGYVARVPHSREEAEARFRRAVAEQDWATLREAGFSYLVLPASKPAELPPAYRDETATVYLLTHKP